MISSSGIIKRGLATTAISALAVTGVPALAGTAHAAVGVTVASLGAYDLDEFGDATPDMVVTVKDGAVPIDIDVEYDVAFTPEVGAPVPADGNFTFGGDTGADGIVDLEFDPALAGSYTVNVRTVGSHIPAPAFTFVAGDAEINWTDGVSASSPQNGSDTYAGTLALTNAAKTPLSGRVVDVNYDSAGNVIMSTPQPAGTARVNDDEAKATTAANGGFSVGLTDPAAPVGTDSGTLEADTGFTAQKDLSVNFEPAPVVKAITIATPDPVFPGTPAPGKPVELDIKVTSEGATPAPADDIVLKDAAVSVTVDKGFLSPDTKPGLNTGIDDLTLTAEQDDKDDLFGFYEDLGKDETVETTDSQPVADNAAGIIAAIERDADFNDDGQATQKVTVTAGGKSATVDITYSSENYLNLPAVAFRRDGGSPRVGGSVDLKLYAGDQFGNLVGNEDASVTDNTPIARATVESGGAETDYLNDNPTVVASSNQPVSQTITAKVNGAAKNLVGANGEIVPSTATTTGAITLNWTRGNDNPDTGPRERIVAKLKGRSNGGRADRLTVVTDRDAAGARVQLFKIRKNGKQVAAGTKRIGRNGRVTFVKADRNGRGFTKYIAKVKPTSDTKGARTNRRNVR